MPTYIAITAGPIVRTLEMARHTRELWTASYLFSWYMKQLAQSLRQDPQRRFILPYADPEDQTQAYLGYLERGETLAGAGLFPDRIIFQTDRQDDLAAAHRLAGNVLEELANDIAGTIVFGDKPDLAHKKAQEAKEYLRGYLNLHLVAADIPLDENPTKRLTPVLDALELRQTFPPDFAPFLLDYLSLASVRKDPTSDLALDAFGERRLLNTQTMEHLAVKQFLTEQSKEYETVEQEDEDSGALVERYGRDPEFIQAHKYVAIVQADGDNVGKNIGRLSADDGQGNFTNEAFQTFNRLMMEFSIKAVKAIEAYGGLPVYAGGDDLLFFAPVLNRNSAHDSQNIFSLLHSLDQAFQAKMAQSGLEFKGDFPLPTMSFGVAIAYYKFPLYESLEAAKRLLFGVAKKTPGKHLAAFEIRKHSGTTFGGRLALGDTQPVAEKYQKLLDRLFVGQNNEVLSSVAQKLLREQDLLNLFGDDPDRVEAYFRNSFNEGIHKRPPQDQFLKDIWEFVPHVYQQFPRLTEDPDTGKPLEKEDPRHPHIQLFGLMRSLQFLIDDTTA